MKEGQSIYRNVPESEFMEMLKSGTNEIYERLEQENHSLKDCLVLLQQELKDIME